MFHILLYHILFIQSSDNNGSFGNYRKIAKVDELFEVIRTVHQDQDILQSIQLFMFYVSELL